MLCCVNTMLCFVNSFTFEQLGSDTSEGSGSDYAPSDPKESDTDEALLIQSQKGSIGAHTYTARYLSIQK